MAGGSLQFDLSHPAVGQDFNLQKDLSLIPLLSCLRRVKGLWILRITGPSQR
jgi:hypothetical protein